MSECLLLTTAYFPPISYINKFLLGKNVLIEKHENYTKQSYRNRCAIYAANGLEMLSIPIKNTAVKIPIAEAQIDYDTQWQRVHMRAIESAYRNSPFYEYYIDDYLTFFIHKEKYLLDLNTKIMEVIGKQLKINTSFEYSGNFVSKSETVSIDYRYNIHPKINLQVSDPCFLIKPYLQVFGEKYGFIPNLSIIDLLFNVGTEAKEYILKG